MVADMVNRDRITAADLANAVGSRKTREILGIEPVGEVTPKKRSKYNVGSKESRTLDGMVFDSKKEMNRYCELKMMADAGQISRLERQPRFALHVNGIKLGEYVADFCYWNGTAYVYEDVKGGAATKTPLYRWKKKHLLAEYGIEIRET